MMDIYNSRGPANLFVQHTPPSSGRAGIAELPLQLGQVVRALVVEGGRSQALLEINRQRYAAQTPSELKTGQQLVLQTTRLRPQLEFRVLSDPLRDRLARQLPQSIRPYQWGALVEQLAGRPENGTHRALAGDNNTALQQLRQILISGGRQQTELKEAVARVVRQLKAGGEPPSLPRLFSAVPSAPAQPGPPSSASTVTHSPRSNPLLERIDSQLRLLEQSLAGNERTQLGQRSTRGGWDITRDLLQLLYRQDIVRRPVPQAMNRSLHQVLQQVRLQPALPPHLSVELDTVLANLVRHHQQTAVSLSRPQPDTTAQSLSKAAPAAGIDTRPEPVPQDPAASSARSSAHTDRDALATLTRLLAEVRAAPRLGSAEIQGQLQGLLTRLQSETANQLPKADADLVGTLTQLVNQLNLTAAAPRGAQLGVLSQLFGLHLEAELLQGRQREALSSLKRALLQMRQQGGEVEEPLQRLEFFQLCKARLAEENVQFLPLPFAELEEGYLLAEQQPDADDTQESAPEQVRMSLSLRLSALGSLRIDISYDAQGLQLRIAGESAEKMNYLQQQTAELREVLQAVTLHGVTYAADAEPPARQLARRLLPDAAGLLDARI